MLSTRALWQRAAHCWPIVSLISTCTSLRTHCFFSFWAHSRRQTGTELALERVKDPTRLPDGSEDLRGIIQPVARLRPLGNAKGR